jgi:hypothetical protein
MSRATNPGSASASAPTRKKIDFWVDFFARQRYNGNKEDCRFATAAVPVYNAKTDNRQQSLY